MNPKSTDYYQGKLDVIYDLLDVIHANNNQVTLKDVEQFQAGQLMAQDEITNNPQPIAVSKEEYIAKAQEVATIQDGQDFGWLDSCLEEIMCIGVARTWRDPDVKDRLHLQKEIIQAHFTNQEKKLWAEGYHKGAESQAKQHQADLLRARIGENENTKLVTYRAEMVRYADKRIAVLQAELDKLEGEK